MRLQKTIFLNYSITNSKKFDASKLNFIILLRMKPIVIILFLLFSVIFQSCNNENKQTSLSNDNSIEAKINFNSRKKIDNNAIGIIYYTALETTKESYLAEASKVVFANSYYFVLDKKFSSLKVFNKSGKFIRTIGKIGHGENDYLSLEDFYIRNRRIYVLSNSSRRIIVYDLDGQYKMSIPFSFFASGMAELPNGLNAFFTNYNRSEESCNLLITDKSNKVIERYLPYGNSKMPSFDFTGFIEKSNSILFSNPLSDSVYVLNNEGLQLKYLFNFEKKRCPENAKENLPKLLKTLKNYMYLEKPIIETKGQLVFRYIDQNQVNYAFWSRTNHLLYTSSSGSLPNIFSKPLGYENEEIISVINTESFFSSTNKPVYNYVKLKFPILFNILNKLKDTDNPVLIQFKVSV